MSYLIKPIKPAMFYAFSRILVWFSELMSALQVCHDMTKFSISDWPRKRDTTWEFCQNSFFTVGVMVVHFFVQSVIFMRKQSICTVLLNTKACFKNYARSTGQAIYHFLVIVAFLMAVAVCLLPFTTAGGARCVLFIFSSWLELGWTWASNIYVHKIHSLRSILVG